MVGKLGCFLALAQLSLLIGAAEVVLLSDEDPSVLLQLRTLRGGADAVKKQEIVVQDRERRVELARQKKAEAKLAADEASAETIQLKDRIQKAGFRLEAAEDESAVAEKRAGEASAALTTTEDELRQAIKTRDTEVADVQNEVKKAKGSLSVATSSSKQAGAKLSKLKAKQEEEENAEQGAAADLLIKQQALKAKLAEVEGQANNAQKQVLELSVQSSQAGMQNMPAALANGQDVTARAEAKARQATIKADAIQERMEQAKMDAQQAASEDISIRQQAADAVADANDAEEVASDQVEALGSKAEQLSTKIRESKNNEAKYTDQVKSLKQQLKAAAEAMNQKQQQFMSDNLIAGQAATLAQAATADTPELRQARMEHEQAHKEYLASEKMLSSTKDSLAQAKLNIKNSEKELQGARRTAKAEMRLREEERSATSAEVAQQELRVRGAREDADKHHAEVMTLGNKQLIPLKVREAQAQEAATQKATEAKKMKSQMEAAEAETAAMKVQVKEVQRDAERNQLKIQQAVEDERRLADGKATEQKAMLEKQKQSAERRQREADARATKQAQDMENLARTAETGAADEAAKAEDDFEEAGKQAQRDAGAEVAKTEAKAKKAKQAADDQTAHVLSLAQGVSEHPPTPCAPNATEEEQGEVMAQGLLDAAKQESNAKMAIEAAELGRSVAAQVDSEVSTTQLGARQMVADEKNLALKNKKNEEAQVKVSKALAEEKQRAAKDILAQEKMNALAVKQQQRDEDRAARQAAEATAMQLAAEQRTKQAREHKVNQLKLKEAQEELQQQIEDASSARRGMDAAASEQAQATRQRDKAETQISQLRTTNAQKLHMQDEKDAAQIANQEKLLKRLQNELHDKDSILQQKKSAAGQESVVAAQTAVDASVESKKFVEDSLQHAAQIKDGAYEDMEKMEDRLNEVKGHVQLEAQKSQEKHERLLAVAKSSEGDYDKAERDYQQVKNELQTATHMHAEAKSTLDTSAVKATEIGAQLVQAKRKADTLGGELREALSQQADMTDRTQLDSQKAKVVVNGLTQQLQRAQGEAAEDGSKKEAAEHQTEVLRKETDEAVLKAKGRGELTAQKLSEQENAAKNKLQQLDQQNDQMAAELRQMEKSSVQAEAEVEVSRSKMKSVLPDANTDYVKSKTRSDILHNQLERATGELERIKMHEEGIVNSVELQKQAASKQLDEDTRRNKEAGKELEAAQNNQHKLKTQLKQHEKVAAKLLRRWQHRENYEASQQTAKSRADQELDDLQSTQAKATEAAAAHQIKLKQEQAGSQSTDADLAKQGMMDAEARTKVNVAKLALKLKDHEQQMQDELADKREKSKIRIQKSSAHAEKQIETADSLANRASLRAQASVDRKDEVVLQSKAEIRLASKQAHADVEAAKKRVDDAETLTKKRLGEKKMAQAAVQRSEAKTEYVTNKEKEAQDAQKQAEKRTEEAKAARDQVENSSTSQVREAAKSRSEAELKKNELDRMMTDVAASTNEVLTEANTAKSRQRQDSAQLQEVKREAADAIAEAQRSARIQVQNSKAEMASTERDQSNRLKDVEMELDQKLNMVQAQTKQQVRRAQEESAQQVEQHEAQLQMQITQAHIDQQNAIARRKQFEKEIAEQKQAHEDAVEDLKQHKQDISRLRGATFDVIDSDDNGSLSREEFVTPQ
jgi:hypothetical protein